MGRQERPVSPGPLHDFVSDLRKLRARTGVTYRALARRAGYSASALSAAASGDALPTLDVVLAYVGACGAGGEEVEDWKRRWQELAESRHGAERGPCVTAAAPTGGAPPALMKPWPWPTVPRVQGAADNEQAANLGTTAGAPPASFGHPAQPSVDVLPAKERLAAKHAHPATGARLPAAEPLSASETVSAADALSAANERQATRKRKQRRLVTPVRMGMAPIILAAAAITAYSVLLPASQNHTQIVPPHPAPVISVPRPSVTAHRAAAAPRHSIRSSPSPHPVRTTPQGTGGGAVPRQGGLRPAPGSLAFLGAPGWNGYCEATGHGTVVRTGTDAYGWHCADGSGIDGNAACAWTYGYDLGQVIGRIQDFYDPQSWQCWRVSRELGAPDFNGYCVVTGQGAVQLISSSNAYGWHCSHDNGTGDDANAVCAWTYGYSTSQVTNRFTDFYDPDSWQCWA
jgi:transcriptional regulator with XRE-family HTH domain